MQGLQNNIHTHVAHMSLCLHAQNATVASQEAPPMLYEFGLWELQAPLINSTIHAKKLKSLRTGSEACKMEHA